MTPEELGKKLHQVEKHEQEHYQRWLDYQEEKNYQETSAGEQEQIWSDFKEISEVLNRRYRSMFLNNQIPTLGYVSGRTGEAGLSPLVDHDQKQTMLASRGLITEQEGIRRWMMIQKHARFGACLPHRHTFLEINYCYAGTVVNHVNEKAILMEAGDLILLEPGCVHKVDICDEGQILMNLVWFPSAMQMVVSKILPGDCELSQFLAYALYSKPGKNNYLYLKSSKVSGVADTLNEIIAEYFTSEEAEVEPVASEVIVEALMQVLFAKLWRMMEASPELVQFGHRPASKVAEVVMYIKEHCVDCNRESVAEYFGYSGSHVSNMLSRHLGKSFVTLRNEFRLERIEELLQTTSLSVQAAAERCGFLNQSYFYQLYKAYFGRLPREENGKK